LIVGQPKKSGNSKVEAKSIDEDPDFEDSELREDQSPCNPIIQGDQPYLYRIIAKNRFPTPFETLDTSASLVFFGQK
jgi:hypothetical protein